jgi:histidine ammonia-lyase
MLELDGHRLKLADVIRVAREKIPVRVSADARERVAATRRFLERCVREGRRIYGVNTGIGHLANVTVPTADLEELQRNIVRSHAAGVGPPLAEDEVRAILLLKINLFAKGHSGVRPVLVERLVEMLTRDVLPVIPAKGSLGASGDLAPLAHVGLALIGEGEVTVGGRTVPTGEALRDAGLEPLVLSYKEGLGIINGCQVMAGRGTLLYHDASILLRTAQLVSAAVLDVLGASARPFDEKVHRARPYPGQVAVAANLVRLLAGDRELSDRVQDAYSLRCVPQILGGVSDAFDDLERRLDVEINAASDNPLVFPDEEEVIAAGNFHGESLALGLDHFGTAVSEIGSLAERQVNRLLNPALSGLPAFLAPETGKNSGLMIMQYSAREHGRDRGAQGRGNRRERDRDPGCDRIGGGPGDGPPRRNVRCGIGGDARSHPRRRSVLGRRPLRLGRHVTGRWARPVGRSAHRRRRASGRPQYLGPSCGRGTASPGERTG